MKNVLIKLSNIKTVAAVCMLLATCCFSACKDFLNVDDYFDDEFKIDSVFTQRRYVEAYMWGMVNLFPDESKTVRFSYTPGPMASDEAIMPMRATNSLYEGINITCGVVTPDRLGYLNTWSTYYKIIRKCNTILTRLDEVPDMTVSDRHYIEGYSRFFRAYAYYNILVDFGPPILLGDELVENNEEMAYYDRPRNTYDEAVDYICTEFEAAGTYMPLTVSLIDFGKPTRGVAYSLISRLRLIHASDAFNGGASARRYFSSWTRKTDDVHYVQQNYDENRWALAAAAAKKVMDMELAGKPLYSLYTVAADANTPPLPESATDPGYRLNNYPDGAAGIDAYRSYDELFSGECSAPTVSEFIWARRSTYLRDDMMNGVFPSTHGQWGWLAVTQKVVDAYLMDDGRTKDEALNDGHYSETGYTGAAKTFSGYRLNAGVSNMYVNREMRFYASVGFCEGFWPCESTSAPYRDYTAKYYANTGEGKGTSNDPLYYSLTGYVLKKWIHPLDAVAGTGARRQDKTYPILRYAEVLLNYAEALNNVITPVVVDEKTVSRDVDEIKKAFNQVRYRAGLPGLTDTDLASKERVQELIERERMVEFLYENRRYYDVRRWGKYEETENEPIMGMNVDATEKDAFYTRVTPVATSIVGRMVDKKLMFVPIPRAEIRRIPSLDQNPGW
jgi:hypothetical protein